MHAELSLSVSTLIAFLLVLARMVGIFVLVPMPVKDVGPSIARVVLALGCTVALFPRWPTVNISAVSLAMLLRLLATDAALGMAIGLMVSFLSEAFTLGAHSLALQAGYGYASVVDPTNQADSDVLPVMAQLMAGLFFFTTGLHRYLIKVFADSLESYPPGSFALKQNLAKEVIHLGSNIFSVGLRLALPVIGLLLMVEIALALLGRINSQLHFGMHAAPVKMLLTLLAIASILAVTPNLYMSYAEGVFGSIRQSFLR